MEGGGSGDQHWFCKKVPPPPKGRRAYQNSQAVESLLRSIQQLSKDDYFALCQELMKTSTLNCEQLNTIKNVVTAEVKSKKKKASEQQRNVDSRAEDQQPGSSTTSCSSSNPSALASPRQSIASKVSLIVRGDLINESSVVCYDIEKVTDRNHKNIAGDFAMVDLDGRLLLWCYVYRDEVCKFNTKLTGLTREKLDKGISIGMLQDILKKVLSNQRLVGAAVCDDLRSIGFGEKGEKLPEEVDVFDLQSFYRDRYGDPISLSLLGQHFLDEAFQDSTHSSIRDARMTALCYIKMKKMKDAKKDGELVKFSCSSFDKLRDEQKRLKKESGGKPKIKPDTCTCGLADSKKKKKVQWHSTKDPNEVLNDWFM